MNQPLLRFLRLDLLTYLRQRRWLVPLPLFFLLSYLLNDRMRIVEPGINRWDGILGMFTSAQLFFLLLTPLFLYLVADLSEESAFGRALVFRLRSRQSWWLAKITTLGLTVLLYAVIVAATTVAISSIMLPSEGTWSPAIARMTTSLHPDAPELVRAALAIPPYVVLGKLLVLVILGWFALGLLAMVISQLTHQPNLGFITALLINFSGLAGERYGLPTPLLPFTINRHFLLVPSPVGLTHPATPYSLSLLYWAIWITLLLGTSYWLGTRQDFLRKVPAP